MKVVQLDNPTRETGIPISKMEDIKQRWRLEDNWGPFSIISWVYEAELDKKYNIVLKKLRNGEPSTLRGDWKDKFFFNKFSIYDLSRIENQILKRHSSLPGFCSMEIDTREELFEHIKKIYEINYLHYAWAKERNMKESFPNNCCGRSSKNIFLTLMMIGYPNAAFVYNDRGDHAYVVLPFLLEEKEGFLIIDPTSDQLFHKRYSPRNSIFMVLGRKWRYRTDWRYGHNLYPSPEDFSTFSNLHTLRIFPYGTIYEDTNIEGYFKEVFKNPLRLDDFVTT